MRKLAMVLSLAAIAGIGVAVYPLDFAAAESGRCPGKIICPLTGEEVCRDECPLIDARRADCPGKVECPLTGELVCRDECPLGVPGAGGKPSCCLSARAR